MNCCRALCMCMCFLQSCQGLPKSLIDPQGPLRPLIKWSGCLGDSRGTWKFLKFLRLILRHPLTHTLSQFANLLFSLLLCVCVCVYMYPNNLPFCLSHPSAPVTDGLTPAGPAPQMDFSLPLKPTGRGLHGPGLSKRLGVWTEALELCGGDREKDQWFTLRISGLIE